MEQNTQSHRRFYRAAKRRSSLGDAEVQRIIDLCRHQPVSGNHTVHVRRLERNYYVAKAEILKNSDVPHSALDHRFGRRGAVFLEQILFE